MNFFCSIKYTIIIGKIVMVAAAIRVGYSILYMVLKC